MGNRKIQAATLMLALLGAPAHAGWWGDFCSKYLVADDPYPYAKEASDYLLARFAQGQEPGVRKELVYRYRAGMLTANQGDLLLKTMGTGTGRSIVPDVPLKEE